jgi:hypothetical protein
VNSGTAPLRDVARGAAIREVAATRLTPRALVTPVATSGTFARFAGRAGVGVGVAFAAADVAGAWRREGGFGPQTRHAAGRGVGGVAGALAGAKLGGAAGAAIGTAILPGVGTAVGGAVGALAGAFIGSSVGARVGGGIADAVGGAVSRLNPFD